MTEPLISLRLYSNSRVYRPGDELVCDYQIDLVPANEIHAVEASVLWYTEGKGDEDLGIHYFERRVPADVPRRDLRQLRRFTTELPNSPLSYAGLILKIRWCVRVRLFMRRGRGYSYEEPFRLGNVPPAASDDWPPAPAASPRKALAGER